MEDFAPGAVRLQSEGGRIASPDSSLPRTSRLGINRYLTIWQAYRPVFTLTETACTLTQAHCMASHEREQLHEQALPKYSLSSSGLCSVASMSSGFEGRRRP